MKRSTSDREAAAKAGMLFPYEELSDAELARRRADGGESSDEETRNTVGDVPEEWYADQAHIGYDREGRRLLKAPGWERRRDAIERFLDAKDDPDHWRRFYDAREDTEHVLSDADLRVVGALLDSRFAAARTLLPGGIDPDWPVAPVDPQEAAMPTGLDALRKRDFAPSKIERKAVWKLAKLIAKGWIKPPSAESSTRRDQDDDDVTDFAADAQFDLWATPGAQRPGNLPPPPAELPGHADSYNPPAEYLPTEAEAERLEQQKLPVPRKYKSLRSVPGDSGLLKHMYRRCLELYLRPRMPPLHAKRKAARLDHDQLLAREQAKLPSPEELRPFPTAVAVVYRGHGDGAMVRSVAPDPIAGQWLASGADDGGLRLWEVETGRCVAVAALGEDTPVRCVSWRPLPKQVGEEAQEEDDDDEGRRLSPKQERRFLAVAAGHCIFLVEPHILAGDDAEDEGAQSPIESDTDAAPGVSWRRATEDETAAFANFGRIDAVIEHADDVASLSWHHGGDYLLVVTQLDVAQPVRNTAAIVHRVSGHSSRRLHISSKAGPVQTATFDPSGKPHVYIATQRAVRIYNVGAKKKRTKGKRSPLEKKLLPGVRWVSTVAVHPTGRHTIIGSFDKRVCWFESELSSRPFKMMRHHRMAVRRVTFHPLAGTTLPLFASCSDDGRTHIFHAGIPAEDDWNANPLLVPLRVLHGHALHEGYGVLDIAFHPTQPWIFTAGADGTIVLHTDKETAMH